MMAVRAVSDEQLLCQIARRTSDDTAAGSRRLGVVGHVLFTDAGVKTVSLRAIRSVSISGH
jgi:hypothetical protein